MKIIMQQAEVQAHDLVDELSNNYEAWVGDVDVHYAEVCILAPRTIPAGLLEVVSNYGDMRVEGTCENKTEISVLI